MVHGKAQYQVAVSEEKTLFVVSLEEIFQEICQARQNVCRQGCKVVCSTINPSSVVLVKVYEGKFAVGQGVKVLSPDISVLPQVGARIYWH